MAALDALRHHQLTPHLAAVIAPFPAAVLTGGLLVPPLLPWLPVRYFALKGATAGALLIFALWFLLPMGIVEAAGTALLVVAITSYMAMTFTGPTTFTTLAGVRLEVRRALPLILIAAGVGAMLRVAGAFIWTEDGMHYLLNSQSLAPDPALLQRLRPLRGGLSPRRFLRDPAEGGDRPSRSVHGVRRL